MKKARDREKEKKKNPEKALAPQSSPLAWKIPWMEEPGGLQSMHGVTTSQTWLSDFTFTKKKKKREKSAVANGGLKAVGWLRGGPGLPERCLWANRKESLPAPLCPWQPRNNTCLCFISGHALENSGSQKPTRIFRKRWWKCGMQRGSPGGNFTRLGLSRERCTAPPQPPTPRMQGQDLAAGTFGEAETDSQAPDYIPLDYNDDRFPCKITSLLVGPQNGYTAVHPASSGPRSPALSRGARRAVWAGTKAGTQTLWWRQADGCSAPVLRRTWLLDVGMA